jgi:hypothetical protein
MRQWYRKRDLLSEAIEHVIPAESTLDATVRKVVEDAGLDRRTTPLGSHPGGRIPSAGSPATAH